MNSKDTTDRVFSTSDIADYDYCALAWWYQHYNPLMQQDNEELFACLVELESIHGTQAPLLPEYQVIEQILLQRGAFDTREETKKTSSNAKQDIPYTLEPQISPEIHQQLRRVTIICGLLSVVLLIGSFLLSMYQ